MSAAEILTAVGVGVVVFVATNIDDILLLAVFFADDRVRPRSVVIGQLAGMAALTLASALCALAALVVPSGFIALLGVVPLALGLWQLVSLRRSSSDDDDEAPPDAGKLAGERSQILTVALVTIANGGDNVAVYIPLFARSPATIPIHAAVFAVMTVALCAAGYLLVNNRLVGERVRRYGRVALPFVLIALGLYILAGARTLLD